MKLFARWTKPKIPNLYHNIRTTPDEEYGSTEVLLDEASLNQSVHWSEANLLRCEKSTIKCLYASLLLNAALIAGLAILRSAQLHQYLRDPFNNRLIKQVSMPSPILDQLHIPLRTERRDGSLLSSNLPSLYRQEPSDKVDDAWNRLTNINLIPISARDVKNIGYDPEIVARWPNEYGLGDDAYVARLDVFHEIHCLNMLRQEIHYDYYGRAKPHEAPPDHRVHISHCIHTLLQSFMCSANTDPIIHYWVDMGDEPYPDFSINRQCRDFESVLQWQEENSIPMSQFRDVVKKPQGVAPRIISLEYKYIVGLINQNPAINLTTAKSGAV